MYISSAGGGIQEENISKKKKKPFKENFRVSNIVPITVKFKGAIWSYRLMCLDALNILNWNDGGFSGKLWGRVGLYT